MHQDVDTLFKQLWRSYLQVTPSASKVKSILGDNQQQDVINDHIALRTFNLNKINLDKLAAHFIGVGYQPAAEYQFKEKKLYAKHFEHADPTLPKVFISQLLIEAFSPELQNTVARMVAQIPQEAVIQDNFLYSGRHWTVSYANYQQLLQESEYAAWMAAWGFRANHFTVSCNHLQHFNSIEQINQALKNNGFELNSAGGEIKGSPATLLEQSSTLADHYPVDFSEGSRAIPSCFYEFARRYPKADGELFSGFVAASADKIFESTNTR